jgi:hypothetical protein
MKLRAHLNNTVAAHSIPTAYQPKAANISSYDLLAVGIIRRYFCAHYVS